MKREKRKKERGRRKRGGEEKKESLLRSTSVKNAISVFTRCLRVSYELAERVLELYPPLPSQVLYIIDNRTLIGLSIMDPIDTIDRVLSFRHGGI